MSLLKNKWSLGLLLCLMSSQAFGMKIEEGFLQQERQTEDSIIDVYCNDDETVEISRRTLARYFSTIFNEIVNIEYCTGKTVSSIEYNIASEDLIWGKKIYECDFDAEFFDVLNDMSVDEAIKFIRFIGQDEGRLKKLRNAAEELNNNLFERLYSQTVYKFILDEEISNIIFMPNELRKQMIPSGGVFELESDQIENNSSRVSAVISPDSKYVVSFLDPYTFLIYSTEEGEVVNTIRHDDWVTSVAISSDSKYVVTGYHDGFLQTYSLEGGEVAYTREHTDRVASIAISSDSAYVLTRFDDGLELIYAIEDGTIVDTINSDFTIGSVAISSDNNWLIITSRDSVVQIMKIISPRSLEQQAFLKMLNLYCILNEMIALEQLSIDVGIDFSHMIAIFNSFSQKDRAVIMNHYNFLLDNEAQGFLNRFYQTGLRILEFIGDWLKK